MKLNTAKSMYIINVQLKGRHYPVINVATLINLTLLSYLSIRERDLLEFIYLPYFLMYSLKYITQAVFS
jgi:hypothetical protein